MGRRGRRSLQGYADKRVAEDVDPYEINDVLSDECAKSVGVIRKFPLPFAYTKPSPAGEQCRKRRIKKKPSPAGEGGSRRLTDEV